MNDHLAHVRGLVRPFMGGEAHVSREAWWARRQPHHEAES